MSPFLIRDPRSRYWQIRLRQWNAARGKWVWTTKSSRLEATPQNRRRAKAMAIQLQAAAEAAGPDAPDPQPEDIRRIVDGIMRAAGIKSASAPAFSEFARRWLDMRSPRITKGTAVVYRSRIRHFLKFAKDRPMDSYTGEDIQRAYNAMLGGASAESAKNSMGMANQLFARAVAEGMIARNPVKLLEMRKGAQKIDRQALTDADVAKADAYLAALDSPDADDWRMLLAIGHDTGGRIGDCAAMTWDNIEGDVIAWKPQKTGGKRTVALPVGKMLAARLAAAKRRSGKLCGALNPIMPVHPSHSAQFIAILDAAGVDTGKAVRNGRAAHRKSFHGLRRKMVQDMEAAGVPADIRMRIVAHTQKATHDQYGMTGINPAEIEALRKAMGR